MPVQSPQQASTPFSVEGRTDQHAWRGFLLLSIFYFLAVAGLSWVKLLWLDELITLHIAQLGSVAAIWEALRRAADPNPPLMHIAVMLCRRILGEHALVLRLPAIAGYWVGMAALFAFLKRRLPSSWALAGTVWSMTMGGFDWSYESRSYAVFYGSTMLAIDCWARIAEEGNNARVRYTALFGLSLSLMVGICTNYFSIMALIPIVAGEAVRVIEKLRRREVGASFSTVSRVVDWPMLIALGVAMAPLLVFRPLIRLSVIKFEPYAWNRVSIDAVMAGYRETLIETIPLLLTLFVLVLGAELLSNLSAGARAQIWPRQLGTFARRYPGSRTPLLTLAEATALSALVAYPFLGFAVASIRGGMLAARFVIPVCLGCAIAGTLFGYRLFGTYRRAGQVAVALGLIWFTGREAAIGYHYEVAKESFYRVIGHLPASRFPGDALAVGDNLLVLPLQYYAPKSVSSRIVYPIDFAATQRYRGEASAEVNLWNGRGYVYSFPVVPLATLQQSSSSYVIITGQRDWLVPDLRDHRYDVDPMPIDTEAVDLDFSMTPFAHGKPEIFLARGDQYQGHSASVPERFNENANLPNY